MTNVDSAFEQQVLYLPQAQRKSHIHHRDKPNDPGDELNRLNGLSGLRRLGIQPTYPPRLCRQTGTVSLTSPTF